MAKREEQWEPVNMESISHQVDRELASIEREKRARIESISKEVDRKLAAIEDEKRRHAEELHRKERYAKTEPERRALATVIQDLERNLAQLDYEIRRLHQGVEGSANESGLRKLRALLDERDRVVSQLRGNRESLRNLQDLR